MSQKRSECLQMRADREIFMDQKVSFESRQCKCWVSSFDQLPCTALETQRCHYLVVWKMTPQASFSPSNFSLYIIVSVWPIYHPVSFSRSATPFLTLPLSVPHSPPFSPQHLHHTLCPGQPLIIFTHQNVDQLHFMWIENHKFCSAWTAPRLESSFRLFSDKRTHWGKDRKCKREMITSLNTNSPKL